MDKFPPTGWSLADVDGLSARTALSTLLWYLGYVSMPTWHSSSRCHVPYVGEVCAAAKEWGSQNHRLPDIGTPVRLAMQEGLMCGILGHQPKDDPEALCYLEAWRWGATHQQEAAEFTRWAYCAGYSLGVEVLPELTPESTVGIFLKSSHPYGERTSSMSQVHRFAVDALHWP